MNIRSFVFKCIVFLLLPSGCADHPAGIVRIKLNRIHGNARGVLLNQITDSLKVIEFQSGEIPVGQMRVIGEAENKLYGYSSAGDFYIFNDNGKLLKTFNRRGRGPGEYVSIWEAKLDREGRQILILDLNNKLLKFTLDGLLAEESSAELIQSISDIAPLGNGKYAGTVLNSGTKKNNVIVFDSLYHPLNRLFPVRDISQTNISGMVNIESVEIFNSKVYYKAALGDTLFSIYPQGTEPLLILEQGNLKMPAALSVRAGSEAKREKNRYIDGLYGKIAGRYYLGSYWYKNRNYYDLWSLDDGKNIIHQPLDKKLYEKGIRAGLPVEIGGRILYVWPGHVQENVLYAVTDYSYFYNSAAREDENKNPVLIKIWLKK